MIAAFLLIAAFVGPMVTPSYGFVWFIGCIGATIADIAVKSIK